MRKIILSLVMGLVICSCGNKKQDTKSISLGNGHEMTVSANAETHVQEEVKNDTTIGSWKIQLRTAPNDIQITQKSFTSEGEKDIVFADNSLFITLVHEGKEVVKNLELKTSDLQQSKNVGQYQLISAHALSAHNSDISIQVLNGIPDTQNVDTIIVNIENTGKWTKEIHQAISREKILKAK